jgi:hypothetical protein
MTTSPELEEGYDSSPTTTHVRASFPPLFGVTFYNSRPIRSGDDPESYHLQEISVDELGWHWYVEKTLPVRVVRAFKATSHGYRILGAPVGAGKSAMDIPSGRYIVTDNQCVWSLSPEEFLERYMMAVPPVDPQDA